jgi:hypothetical protein
MKETKKIHIPKFPRSPLVIPAGIDEIIQTQLTGQDISAIALGAEENSVKVLATQELGRTRRLNVPIERYSEMTFNPNGMQSERHIYEGADFSDKITDIGLCAGAVFGFAATAIGVPLWVYSTKGEVKGWNIGGSLAGGSLIGIGTGMIGLGVAAVINALPFVDTEGKQGRREYSELGEAYYESNLRDANEKTKHIQIFQGRIEEIERITGKKAKLVPETFAREDNIRGLKIRAYLLGATAIAHYQPGSLMGMPIKLE